MSRGRRFEVGGFGAVSASALTILSGALWAGYFLGIAYIALEDQCELLSEGLEEFKRGVAA